MKKMIYVVLFLVSILNYAQSKYNIEQVELSDDPRVLANFIVNNPDHPKTPVLKQKLGYIVTSESNNKSAFTKESIVQKPNIQERTVKNKTTEILNHLLNDNSKSGNAYILIKNLSKCGIKVDFKGKESYSVDIKPLSDGRILIAKGNYNVSSRICNANYNTHKNIMKDFQISLNHN